MSPEGLNQRFNQTAVAFLRAVFTSLLTQKKQTAYLQLNMAEILHLLKSGEKIEILEAYIGHKTEATSLCHHSSINQ